MKFLRHPIDSIREPFGTAGLIVAMVTLILALGGTALAAKGALTGKQKKEVTKIAQKYAGKPGEKGDKGDPGAAGKNGTNGTNGAPGAAGQSVVASAAAVPGECPAGTSGTKFEVQGSGVSSHVCSGKDGQDGQTGFTEVLPEGKTETGTYSYNASLDSAAKEEVGPGSFEYFVHPSVSFAIPLSEILPQPNVKYAGAPECTGSFGAPTAAPGYMCVYPVASINSEMKPEINAPAGPVGMVLTAKLTSDNAWGFGVFAVTAAEE